MMYPCPVSIPPEGSSRHLYKMPLRSATLGAASLVSFGELRILLAFLMFFVLASLPTSLAWRWMLGLGVVTAIALLVHFGWSPPLPHQNHRLFGDPGLPQTSVGDCPKPKLPCAVVFHAGYGDR